MCPIDWRARAARVLTGIVLAAAVIALAIAFGPVPAPTSPRSVRQAPPTPLSVASVEPTEPKDEPVTDAEVLVSLFGATRVTDSEGCRAIPLDQYIAEVDAEYRAAGYQPSDPHLGESAGGGSGSPTTFWYARAGSQTVVGAFSVAKPSRSGNRPLLEMTYARKDPSCGTGWKKYHYEMHGAGRRGIGLASTREAGRRAGIPVPPDTEHLFSLPASSGAEMDFYSTGMPPDALRDWFRKKMSGNWSPVAIGKQSAGSAGGLLYFTQQGRYCMIFVGEGWNGKSTVVIDLGSDIG